jgi:thioredoxin-related protein
MKTPAKTLSVAGMVLLALAHYAPAADGGWYTDFEAAKAKAKKEKKHLLVNFSGSDWCGWCIRLDREIFSNEAFTKEAPKHFVLVELDFPQRKEQPAKLKTQNEELRRRFRVSGFPTIIMADAKARPYGRTGYQPGGPEAYLKHLLELRANKLAAEELFAKAEKAKGLEKARLLDEALGKLEKNGPIDSYQDVIESIKKLDPKNKGGLKAKYESREKLAAIELGLQRRDVDGTLEKIEEFVKEYSPSGETRQKVFFIKAVALFSKDDSEGAIAALETALKAAPESAMATQITMAIGQLKRKIDGDN